LGRVDAERRATVGNRATRGTNPKSNQPRIYMDGDLLFSGSR
jgi:hypothetical protein